MQEPNCYAGSLQHGATLPLQVCRFSCVEGCQPPKSFKGGTFFFSSAYEGGFNSHSCKSALTSAPPQIGLSEKRVMIKILTPEWSLKWLSEISPRSEAGRRTAECKEQTELILCAPSQFKEQHQWNANQPEQKEEEEEEEEEEESRQICCVL